MNNITKRKNIASSNKYR